MLVIDIRCSASLGHPTPEAGRCQLGMGHEGAHAVMFARGDHRVVRTWRRRRPGECTDVESGFASMPWLRGYPVPAWAEVPAHH